MKTWNLFNHRIMNEAGDIDAGGGDAGDIGGMSSSEAFQQSSNAVIGEDEGDVFAKFGLDAKKYNFDEEENSDESLEEESQGSDEDKEAGQAPDEKSFLNLVNSLGLVHSDNPFQVGSKDELKTLLQQGKDYTVKTQALSQERKEWESAKVATETELNAAIEEFNNGQKEFEGKIQELQNWSFALKELEARDPDLLAEVKAVYEGVVKQFSNPVLDQQLKAIRAELAETKKGLVQEENKALLDKFEREKASMSATEQSMKELGITVDWDEAQKEWAKSGQPLSKVVGALYFDSLAKAQASKSKVESTKAKVSAKATGGASGSRTGTKVKTIDPKLKGLAYASALLDKYAN